MSNEEQDYEDEYTEDSVSLEEEEEISNAFHVHTFEPPVTNWISTGCTLLDLAISNKWPGGFPSGRITHLFGDFSTCKSVLAAEAAGSCQRQGGLAFFLDAERTFDADRASRLYGVDVANQDTFFLSHPTTIEEVFDDYIRAANKKIKEAKATQGLMIVDSLAALPGSDEVVVKKGERKKLSEMKGFGAGRAKTLSTAFRTSLADCAETGLGLILVDQERDDLTALFKRSTTSSGRAITFYASLRVQLAAFKKIVNTNKKETGMLIRAKVAKSKVGPPHRTVDFVVDYEYGIDDIASNLMFIKSETEASSKRYSWRDKSGSLAAVVQHVEENELEEELIQDTIEVWNAVYPPSTRTARRRVV